MVQKFIAYINEKGLFMPENKILLAVSGGIDSVAMLQCFKDAGVYNFGVAHCNFGLRGEESDEDELFVKKLAKRAKVTFHSHFFETDAFANQEKISIQMAARQLRYTWFEKLKEAYGYDYIATAHHRNDSLETVLFNLVKGTGIAGLHGISPKSGDIVRPLLFADKEAILDFVAEKQLSWREDSSNESVKYSRNIIRHEVVPVLKKINPDLENSFQHTVDRIQQVEALYDKTIESLAAKAVEKKGKDVYIDLGLLKSEDIGSAMLWELIKPYGFNYVQAKEIFERLFDGAGKIFDAPTYRLNIDREHLILSPSQLGDFFPSPIQLGQKTYENENLALNFATVTSEGFKITSNKKTAALDFELLKFPLELRKWQRGDVFFPLGMKQKKKLSDFMIDEKIPLNLKERVFVLTSEGKIVWVIGYRLDDRFKITENTKTVFRVQIT